MYTLGNDELRVEILDPLADQSRFGVRYCTGGYIFQVHDARHGALLTGPTYPESFNWFDGQGIPDAFNLSPQRAPGDASGRALVLGIGVCDLAQRQVEEFCSWEIEADATRITMRTTHDALGYGAALHRTVSLNNRTLRSFTRLHNSGALPIQMSWFPHPFFPQTGTPELCRLNLPLSAMPENPGYLLNDSGWIARRAAPDQRGFYQALDLAENGKLVILQHHPALGLLAATCSYAPTFFPIWGNQHTFSWEPFFERTLAPGQQTEWWIDYDF